MGRLPGLSGKPPLLSGGERPSGLNVTKMLAWHGIGREAQSQASAGDAAAEGTIGARRERDQCPVIMTKADVEAERHDKQRSIVFGRPEGAVGKAKNDA